MQLDDEQFVEEEEHGEGWVVTFADMMALLMSFFVLLLSFSEQDEAKFKEVGGSLEHAFGVQREIPTYEKVKGTSIIARNYSPGKPSKSSLNELRQDTTNESKRNLNFDENKQSAEKSIDFKQKNEEEKAGRQFNVADSLAKRLSQQIEQGRLNISVESDGIRIRILEKGYFMSGQSKIEPSFKIVLDQISNVLEQVEGKIIISGHTDNVPISNGFFQSNWDLSASRAAAVVNYLINKNSFNPERFEINAFAETQPMASNETSDDRRKNRRVEILLKS